MTYTRTSNGIAIELTTRHYSAHEPFEEGSVSQCREWWKQSGIDLSNVAMYSTADNVTHARLQCRPHADCYAVRSETRIDRELQMVNDWTVGVAECDITNEIPKDDPEFCLYGDIAFAARLLHKVEVDAGIPHGFFMANVSTPD